MRVTDILMADFVLVNVSFLITNLVLYPLSHTRYTGNAASDSHTPLVRFLTLKRC